MAAEHILSLDDLPSVEAVHGAIRGYLGDACGKLTRYVSQAGGSLLAQDPYNYYWRVELGTSGRVIEVWVILQAEGAYMNVLTRGDDAYTGDVCEGLFRVMRSRFGLRAGGTVWERLG
jgi:hypothetical protein